MTSILQPTFAGGELSPSMHARVDVARYYIGLKLCKNFLIMPYGGAKNRPGTQFVAEVKDSTKRARLIPFQFSDEQTYVLVFGDETMRVIKDGGEVLNTSGPDEGLPFELAVPFDSAELPLINYTQSADVMTFAHPSHKPSELKRLAHDNWTIADLSLVPSIAAPASATSTPAGGSGTTQSWRYQVTAVVDDANSIEESLPVTSNAVTVYASTAQATTTWPAVTGASYYNIYKDSSGSGVFGFIGRSTTTSFTDNNITAVKTDTPPTGEDPFVGAGNYPGAVGYYQQRLVFGGSNNKPQTLWFSKTGVFNNFGYSIPFKDDDAITYTIVSGKVQRVRHLVSLKRMLGFTSGGEWLVRGADSGFTAKTITAEQEGHDGCSIIPPIVVGSSAVYVQARGGSVASFGYELQVDGFAGNDLTLYSAHLFQGHTLLECAYQKIPDSIVWFVRSDGVLLGMTYLPEQQVIAWHQHHTDGFVESVACIPEGDEDSLYLLVRRNINGVERRYIERMASRRDRGAADSYFVDCGLTYDGRNSDPGKTMQLSGGADWKYPEEVTLSAAGHSPFTVGSIGQHYALNGENGRVRVEVTGYTSSAEVTVRLLIICPEDVRDVPVTAWDRQTASLTGLDHLDGKTVSVLADGNVHPVRVVDGGGITLDYYAGVVHAGLPYESDLETLDIELQNAAETVINKKIAVTSLTVLVEKSRGIFAGPDAAHLYEHKQRQNEDYEQPVQMLTGQAEITIPNSWSSKGRVFIRQSDPLPLTILGVIPEATFGGR